MPADKHKSSPLVWPCWPLIMFLEAKSWHGGGWNICHPPTLAFTLKSLFLWVWALTTKVLHLFCTTNPLHPDSPPELSLEYKGEYHYSLFFSSMDGEAMQSFHLNRFYTVTGISLRAFLLQPTFLHMDSTKPSHVSLMFLIRNWVIRSR